MQPESSDNSPEQWAARLQRAQRELQALYYAVSHDLRAPVRAITGFSQALREHSAASLDDTGLQMLLRVEQATQRLSAMVDGLLQLSRLGQSQLQPARVDVTQLCHNIAIELSAQSNAPAPQLEIGMAMYVWADPQLLRIALKALLHNAWKFTQGSATAHINISANDTGKSVTLCVRDNGIGIDMQYAQRLFVPFQHLQSHAALNGVGIGLASVQRIITLHGGSVWIEAQPKQYTACYCSLPWP